MKFNKWTYGLAAVGAVSLVSAARADETHMSQLQTALSTTTISGYVDVGGQYNIGNEGNGQTPNYGFAHQQNEFSLNAVDITLERPLDESPWAAGYHAEIMFGPDSPLNGGANVQQIPASGGNPNTFRNVNGLSQYGTIRQAYISLRTPLGNGIDWKIGVFDTIIGYESTTAGANPNYTRSYGYTLEPTTYTGVVGSYKVCDVMTIQGGVANGGTGGGFNSRSSVHSQKTYLGAVALTAPDSWGWFKGATMNLGYIHHVANEVVGNSGTVDNYYAGITMPTPWNVLKVGAAFDWVEIGNGSSASLLNPKDDQAFSGAIYANFQATDKLSFSLRGEYLEDGTGQIYNDGFGGNVSAPSPSGLVKVEALTLTTTYNLWANVLSRVELRYDHVEDGNGFGFNSSVGAPNKSDSFLVAFNLIYKF